MNSENPRAELPLGLLELDTDGTVLYYKPEGAPAPAHDIVGRNLFDDLVGASNRDEFRQEVRRYSWSREPSRMVPFTFTFGDTEVAVTLLLARMREHTAERGDRESLFVLIKPAA